MNPAQKCEAPVISGGRSPRHWINKSKGNKLRNMFPVLKKTNDLPKAKTGSPVWIAYDEHVQAVIDTYSMALDSRLLSTEVLSSSDYNGIPLSTALSKNCFSWGTNRLSIEASAAL